jgi:hypothetical protein
LWHFHPKHKKANSFPGIILTFKEEKGAGGASVTMIYVYSSRTFYVILSSFPEAFLNISIRE